MHVTGIKFDGCFGVSLETRCTSFCLLFLDIDICGSVNDTTYGRGNNLKEVTNFD